MTDISKTKSELLADLADNTRERVSPQTLRNMVSSLRDPVPLGGLEGVNFDPAQESVSIYITSQPDSVLGIEVPNSVVNWIQLNPEGYVGYTTDPNTTSTYFYDPAGHVSAVTDPPLLYDSQFTGGKYLKNIPPRSVWRTVTSVTWWPGTFSDADLLSMSGCYPMPNYAYPVNWLDDNSLGIYSAPIYAYSGNTTRTWGSLAGNSKQYQNVSAFTVPDYTPTNDAFFMQTGWVNQTSGETQRIRHIEIDITRLA